MSTTNPDTTKEDQEDPESKPITLLNCGYLENLKKDDYGEGGERKKDPYFNFNFDPQKWRLFINKQILMRFEKNLIQNLLNFTQGNPMENTQFYPSGWVGGPTKDA